MVAAYPLGPSCMIDRLAKAVRRCLIDEIRCQREFGLRRRQGRWLRE